jgi:tetratricopeptide (TPR) repeat protein
MRWLAAKTAMLALAGLGGGTLSAERAGEAVFNSPLLPAAACAPDGSGGGGPSAAQASASPLVLIDGLGFAGIEADSANDGARAWFAQGVRLIWAFDEAEAIRAFQKAQRLDPHCALCFFGEAWARGPTINLQPRTEELEAARTAAQHAVTLAGRLGPRDRLLVDAMALRTRAGPAFSNEDYARFMANAAARLPGDDTIAILAADARMVLSVGTLRAGSPSQRLLEHVLERSPDHVGAIHLYIHLMDWTGEQARAVPYAERLGRLAPAASHLVHMPSHSFFGVGRYADAARANVEAIAADTAFTRRLRPPFSDYRWGLRRHDMQFAIESALAHGDGATALAVSRQYRADFLGPDAESGARLLGSAASYADGLYGEIDAVLAAPAPARPFEKVMRHYARGEALARRGDAAAIRAEAAAVAAIRDGSDAPALGAAGSALAEVIQYVLEGRAAMAAGQPQAAATAYRRAMDRQLAAFGAGRDPPLFWYSVRRSLGAALLAAGDRSGARHQLDASLEQWPNDAVALYALSLVDRAAGHERAAARNLARARAGWAGDVTQLPLARI